MISAHEADSLPGKALRNSGGETLGTIEAVIADHAEGTFTIAVVNSGAAEATTTFVSLAKATVFGNVVTVSYSRDAVEAAPSIKADSASDSSDVQQLLTYYGALDLEKQQQQQEQQQEQQQQQQQEQQSVDDGGRYQ